MPQGADLHEDVHQLQNGNSVNDREWSGSLEHGLSIKISDQVGNEWMCRTLSIETR